MMDIDKLKKLRNEYLSRLDVEAAEILGLASRHPIGDEALKQLRFLAHSIGGSATLFELPAIGQSALVVEDAIRQAVVEDRELLDDERMALERAVAEFGVCYRKNFSE